MGPTRRRLIAAGAVALLVVVAAVVALRGGGGGPTPAPRPARPDGLALGIVESNPHLYGPGDQPAAFAPWRDRLVALHPKYVRILVNWAALQPAAESPADLAKPADGCLRGLPPCAAFAGLRDQLRAAKAAGLTPVISILGTPEWAARRRQGCDPPESGFAQGPRDLDAYRALVRRVAALGREEGVELPWWSPYNEPNNPDFLSPQRGRCRADAPAVSAAFYASLARAARSELGPGQRILLGETAGYERDSPRTTAAASFARALPDDVVCNAGAWAQHAYVKVEDRFGDRTRPGAASLLRDLEGALDGHGCGERLAIWITETGAEGRDGASGCESMAGALAAWARDPRVDAAFQYTFREDTAFRVGLVDERLTELRPAYAAWRAAADGRPAEGVAACGA